MPLIQDSEDCALEPIAIVGMGELAKSKRAIAKLMANSMSASGLY